MIIVREERREIVDELVPLRVHHFSGEPTKVGTGILVDPQILQTLLGDILVPRKDTHGRADVGFD